MSETEETFSLTGILVSAHLIGLSGLGMLVFLGRISPWYLVDSIALSLQVVIQGCVVLLLVFCSSFLFLPVPHLLPYCWNSHYVRAIDLSYFFYTTLTPTEVT